MPERERVNLTDRAIARLRPRAREYTVWDSRLAGLGVRVRPTGGQSYVLLQSAAGRSRRISLGPVTTMGIAEARRECHARMTDPGFAGAVPARAVPLFRDFVAGEWRVARFERCKPSTKKGIVSVLEGQLLPAFGSKPLDRITLARIMRWFDDFSRTAPGNANHALDLLRRIINFAIACGHVDANPAREVKPNPRPTLSRFLSREEVGRLHRVLDRQTRKGSREQADIIRLLLFHRMPQGRDPGAPLVRGPSRRADAGRQQDRAAQGPPQQPGPSHSRPPAAERKPLRVPLAARSRPPAQPQPRALGPGAPRGRHRGRAPARPPPHRRQPRGNERRAAARGLAAARPLRPAHDAALRPSRRPRDRRRRRKGRAGNGTNHEHLAGW